MSDAPAVAPAGQLWLVPTPIGNLGDVTARSVAQLQAADAIVAEDTRRARALLSHLGIHGKTIHRLDAHRERHSAAEWAQRISGGQCIVLLSDAGTPGVSDPGAMLVRACAAAGVAVQALPGPSAVTTAVAVSGLCSAGFTFIGFLPRARADRVAAIDALSARTLAVVLFESARRLAALLSAIAERTPEREVVVCRELSKVHEQIIRATAREIAADTAGTEWRGEITLVLGPQAPRAPERWSEPRVDEKLGELLAQGHRPKDAARVLSVECGWSVRELYARSCARPRSQ